MSSKWLLVMMLGVWALPASPARSEKATHPAPASRIANVTNESFEKDVLKAKLPVLVLFWAPWAGPAKALEPTVAAIAQVRSRSLKAVKVNTDTESAIAGRYGIMSIPTLVLFKGGQVVETLVGVQQKSTVLRKLRPYLK